MQRWKILQNAVGWLVVLSVTLFWSGCATAPPPANVKMIDCAGAEIEWDVAPEAEIAEFACAMGKKGTDPALIFTVAVKNISDRPLRYRLNIFMLDLDKANGHLVPRKGKPPQVASGDTVTVTVPFIKTTEMPGKLLVRVVPMSE